MTAASWLDRAQGNLRRLSGRTPIRVKIITALLALVIIALAIISTVSLAVFRNYLQGQADTQLITLYDQTLSSMHQPSLFPQQQTHIFGAYQPPDLVEVLNAKGQVLTPTGAAGAGLAGPNVPTSEAWLTAHSGQRATVPALSGGLLGTPATGGPRSVKRSDLSLAVPSSLSVKTVTCGALTQ